MLEYDEKPVLKRQSDGREINVRRLFNVDGFDIIGTVIAVSATKLTVNCDVEREAVRALRHIVRVKIR